MPKLSELTVRLVSPRGYHYGSNVIQAVEVQEVMLEDNLIDFARLKPKYRPVEENDLLVLNDVVVGLKGNEMTSVGIYHSAFPSPEPVTLGSFKIAFRAGNLIEATSIFAALIYRLNRFPQGNYKLELREIRSMPVELLTEDQVTKFLELIKSVHEIRVNSRKRDALLKELIPGVVHKFFKDNGAGSTKE